MDSAVRPGALARTASSPQCRLAQWGLRMSPRTLPKGSTTEAVTIVVARALGGLPLTRTLDHLAITRGLPKALRTDNGPEFCSRAMLMWAHERGVTLRVIEPGKPNQNAFVERFNKR